MCIQVHPRWKTCNYSIAYRPSSICLLCTSLLQMTPRTGLERFALYFVTTSFTSSSVPTRKEEVLTMPVGKMRDNSTGNWDCRIRVDQLRNRCEDPDGQRDSAMNSSSPRSPSSPAALHVTLRCVLAISRERIVTSVSFVRTRQADSETPWKVSRVRYSDTCRDLINLAYF